MAGRKGRIRLETPGELAEWISGFNTLGRALREPTLIGWGAATEVFFSRTQEYVHILSGDLLASGTYRVFALGGAETIVGEVKYGGGTVKYALIEEHRGGSHAYLSRGWEATQREFEFVLPGAFRTTLLKTFRKGAG
jgi:hypothetical protein